ncbi:MAG: small-conductance mechanosensitive channel, partial [Pirellulaceae bacterium]
MNFDKIREFLSVPSAIFDNSVAKGITSTVILILAIVILRWLASRWIRGNTRLPRELARKWIVTAKNLSFLILIAGLVVVWGEELRWLAVSLLAVAAATVIATKELIQCVSGSVLRATGHTFNIGDRIEVAGFRGDVIDMNLLTTTIIEIGPQQLTQQLTGRAVVLPNSMFLDKAVINESFTNDFVLHVFKVPVKGENWLEAEADLMAAATTELAPYLPEARKYFEQFEKQKGMVAMPAEPKVTVVISKPGELELVVRLPVPARRKGRIEQSIIRQYLTAIDERAATERAATERAATERAATE